jgi:hypothetical protein
MIYNTMMITKYPLYPQLFAVIANYDYYHPDRVFSGY